jgi:hypothetical protein
MMCATNTRKRYKAREYPKSEHLAWRRRDSEPLRQASVIDRSESGIRLQSSEGPLPNQGDCIRIASRKSSYPRLARVVRVTNVKGAIVMGCRWVSSVDHKGRHAGRRRPRRLHQR